MSISQGLLDCFGEELLKGEGSVKTADALAGKSGVAVYFSAHWCPPCRGFTPALAKWYAEYAAKNNFEVVFASSDRDDAAFTEYYKEMRDAGGDWLAIPRGDARKDALSNKCKVSGIPMLVVLDMDGAIVTKDGRNGVSKDPAGFPWKPPTFWEAVDGPIVDNKGAEIVGGAASLKSKAAIGIYFSAHWCGPCRGFTPELVKWYEANAERLNMEIIFASSDRDDDAFDEYFGEMPWKALPYDDARKDNLDSMFGVEGIPTLVIVGPDGKLITEDGRSMVDSDKTGADFPWYPKPACELDGRCTGYINESPVFVAMDAKDEAAVTAAAEASVPAQNLERDMYFLWAGEHALVERVKEVCKVQEGVTMAILNLGDGETYQSKEPVTEASIAAYIASFKDGSATAIKMSR